MSKPKNNLKLEWNFYIALLSVFLSLLLFLIPTPLYRRIFYTITPPLIFIVLTGTALILTDRFYKSWIYRIEDNQILLENGFFNKEKEQIAFESIKNVEISRKLRERLFDLYRVNIYIENDGKKTIKGLDHEEAKKIRRELMSRDVEL